MKRGLSGFLEELQGRLPDDLVRVERAISPAHCEVTAILQHLENDQKFPALLFEKPLDVSGKPSSFPLLSNVFATRRRCALGLGLAPEYEGLGFSVESARRGALLLPPVIIPKQEAPVQATE